MTRGTPTAGATRFGGLALAVVIAVSCGRPNTTGAPTASGTGGTASAQAPSAAPSSRASASPTLSRDDAWRTASTTLISERERIHPNPYHGIDRATYLAAADDPRITIEPDIAVPYSSDDYFSDQDPALDAALGADVGP